MSGKLYLCPETGATVWDPNAIEKEKPMNEYFTISVLDLNAGTRVTETFRSAHKATQRVDQINFQSAATHISAEYIGDIRARKYVKQFARVREVQDELLRQHQLAEQKKRKSASAEWKPVMWIPEKSVVIIQLGDENNSCMVRGDKHEVNAKLINDAPKLLAALRDVVRWLDNTGHLYSTDSLVPHLRAAIKDLDV
jgi:hypothetical protein